MENKRVFQYDFMRVIFMLMVLGVHVLANTRQFIQEYNTTWYLFYILSDLFLIGNPLFFMLSGKFNLDKNFSEPEDYKKFYKKRAISILIPFVIIGSLIYVIKNFYNLSIIDYITKMFNGQVEGTYWFVYSLIGILIFSPFFSKMFKNMSDFEKKLFLGIDFVINAIIVIFATFELPLALKFKTVAFAFWHLYYFSGYLIEDIFKTKKSRNIVIILGILSFAIQLFIRRFVNYHYVLTDPSPLLTLETFALYFILLDKIKIDSEKLQKIISYLAQYSFIFYLLHMIVVRNVCTLFELNISSTHNAIYAIAIFILSFIITLAISIIMQKIIIKPIQKFFEKTKSEAR
ncbi:MAG: acyltransferase [Clostridia bacterium]|nr:acyltransferase [Clostridia bacterium]